MDEQQLRAKLIQDPNFSFDALIFHNRTFFAFCFGSGLKYPQSGQITVQLFAVHVCMVQEENQ